MRLTNISATAYGTGSFVVIVGDPETYVNINMTEEETDKVRALVTDMFLSRQKEIAKDIETARPLMIELKPAPVEDDDEIPY